MLVSEMPSVTVPGTAKPFTLGFLRGLKKGGTFTTEGIFQGISGEPVVWTVVSAASNVEWILEARYMGVRIGEFAAMRRKGFDLDHDIAVLEDL